MIIPPTCKAVCFDVDNTLLKTELDYEALRMSIPKTIMGLGVDPRQFSSSGIEFVKDVSNELRSKGVDMPVPEILKRIADDMCAVEMSAADKTTSFPGTVEMLESLKKKGYRLGILTNGFRKYVEHNLSMFDLAKHFEIILSYDDLQFGQQKPEPTATRMLAERMNLRPEEILYVGDSVGDYRSAVGAGAGFVAVTTGHTTAEQWKAIDKNVTVIGCVTELLD